MLYGDVSRRELIEKLDLDQAKAVVLTMDDPVLTARLAKRLRAEHPDLPIIARARDTDHAAALYRAGVTDAVPEALEASLQLSEAVLVDIGVAMGPVIASIHEKRSELARPRSWKRASWTRSRAWDGVGSGCAAELPAARPRRHRFVDGRSTGSLSSWPRGRA